MFTVGLLLKFTAEPPAEPRLNSVLWKLTKRIAPRMVIAVTVNVLFIIIVFPCLSDVIFPIVEWQPFIPPLTFLISGGVILYGVSADPSGNIYIWAPWLQFALRNRHRFFLFDFSSALFQKNDPPFSPARKDLENLLCQSKRKWLKKRLIFGLIKGLKWKFFRFFAFFLRRKHFLPSDNRSLDINFALAINFGDE